MNEVKLNLDPIEYKFSLLVGVKNNLEYTKHFYDTTRKHFPNVEIVFVSYGSSDGTDKYLSLLSSIDENVRVATYPQQATLSDTYNTAAELATGKYLVLCHNDMVLSKYFLTDLEGVMQQMPDNTCITYTTIEPPVFSSHVRYGKLIQDFGADVSAFDVDAFDKYCDEYVDQNAITWRPGAAFFMCIPKSVYTYVGGLDNRFDPMFCEDDDLFNRLALNDVNMFAINRALCYHFVSKTSRFSEEYKQRTAEIEARSNRTYVRKWGSSDRVTFDREYIKLPSRYSVQLIMPNNPNMVDAMERYGDDIVVYNNTGDIQISDTVRRLMSDSEYARIVYMDLPDLPDLSKAAVDELFSILPPTDCSVSVYVYNDVNMLKAHSIISHLQSAIHSIMKMPNRDAYYRLGATSTYEGGIVVKINSSVNLISGLLRL